MDVKSSSLGPGFLSCTVKYGNPLSLRTREKILVTSRLKIPGNENHSDVGLLCATLDARRKWSNGFNLLKEIYFPPRILYLPK